MHPWHVAWIALDLATERTREIAEARLAGELRAAERTRRERDPNPPVGPLRRFLARTA